MCCSGTFSRYFQRFYVINALVLALYVTIRLTVGPVRISHLQRTDGWTTLPKEWEISLSLLVVLASRYRNAPTVDHYVMTVILFLKTLVLIFLFYIDLRYMVWFMILYLVMFLLLKGPRYTGPHAIHHFLNPKDFEDSVTGANADGSVVWLILAVAEGNESCHSFLPVFAELSLRYSTDQLKFGRIDVGVYPELAEVYKIDTGGTSSQLPSFLLFEKKEETRRLPPFNSNGKVVKTLITKEGLIQVFQLDRRLLSKDE